MKNMNQGTNVEGYYLCYMCVRGKNWKNHSGGGEEIQQLNETEPEIGSIWAER